MQPIIGSLCIGIFFIGIIWAAFKSTAKNRYLAALLLGTWCVLWWTSKILPFYTDLHIKPFIFSGGNCIICGSIAFLGKSKFLYILAVIYFLLFIWDLM